MSLLRSTSGMPARRANSILQFVTATCLCALVAPGVGAGSRALQQRQRWDRTWRFATAEIWNINEEHEAIIEGTTGFWGAVHDRIAVGVEFHHLWVVQDAPGAFVQGVSPLVRFQLTKHRRWNCTPIPAAACHGPT